MAIKKSAKTTDVPWYPPTAQIIHQNAAALPAVYVSQVVGQVYSSKIYIRKCNSTDFRSGVFKTKDAFPTGDS